ncbi:hypothetical protein K435DRAFT_860037 [Dendrothele bispora CBS 962.96]|uniref:Uncharacterized protein n=1 Tax=Dendrothele bispora (strain CBS 962.96) TaxID=1314807 RepID=A0A4S8M059_DENBC|nr:hypothetical protein K435DRAFT_860037 [Dendrothele bispora CBS 962.96]
MTDYASQGKTRPCNVVDLNNSRDFRAVYTSLSQGSSAAGTLIFQGFNSDIITGGLKNGGYRQELRELELLDEITHLRYLGQLPAGATGETRSSVLKNFRMQKGVHYLPSNIHPAIAWSSGEPFTIDDKQKFTWKIISAGEKVKAQSSYTRGNFQPVIQLKATENTNPFGKRKAPNTSTNFTDLEPLCKKQKVISDVDMNPGTQQQLHKKSLVWSENSCSYDCVIMLLYHLFLNDREYFDYESAHNTSLIYGDLADAFRSSNIDLDRSRNILRDALSDLRPDKFQIGEYASVEEIIYHILQTDLPFIKMNPAKSEENFLTLDPDLEAWSTSQLSLNFEQLGPWSRGPAQG